MRKDHYSNELDFKQYVLEYLVDQGHKILIRKQSRGYWKVTPDIISEKNNTSNLFEVKFTLTKIEIRKGIGQLIMYGYCYKENNPILWLVAPKDNSIFGIDDEFIEYVKKISSVCILLL